MAGRGSSFSVGFALILRLFMIRSEPLVRCVNIDWLEIYCLEDSRRYPCNADYFRERGYVVNERDFGTRQYKEMFVIEDDHGQPFLEIRRNPFSGDSSFTGLQPESCHIRVVNRYLYYDDPVRILRDFLVMHNYELQRIYRIDVAYDFRRFDYDQNPERFVRNVIAKKFSKINQTKIRAIGDDGWNSFAWESVSWGSTSSMVSTKIYNKTKELQARGNKKPWIVQAWFKCGLIDDPLALPDVWRIEFSLHSPIKNWIVIEDNDGKHETKRTIPHSLTLFDGRDRLWQRFQDLAHHYFRFKYVERNQKVNSDGFRDLKRKDLCRDKLLFRWDADHVFYKIDNPAGEISRTTDDDVLRRRLNLYRLTHPDEQIRQAIDVLLTQIDRDRIRDITPTGRAVEIDQIRLAIASRTGWDYQRVKEKANEIYQLINEGEIW